MLTALFKKITAVQLKTIVTAWIRKDWRRNLRKARRRDLRKGLPSDIKNIFGTLLSRACSSGFFSAKPTRNGNFSVAPVAPLPYLAPVLTIFESRRLHHFLSVAPVFNYHILVGQSVTNKIRLSPKLASGIANFGSGRSFLKSRTSTQATVLTFMVISVNLLNQIITVWLKEKNQSQQSSDVVKKGNALSFFVPNNWKMWRIFVFECVLIFFFVFHAAKNLWFGLSNISY